MCNIVKFLTLGVAFIPCEQTNGQTNVMKIIVLLGNLFTKALKKGLFGSRVINFM
jgi:hypothetical protein